LGSGKGYGKGEGETCLGEKERSRGKRINGVTTINGSPPKGKRYGMKTGTEARLVSLHDDDSVRIYSLRRAISGSFETRKGVVEDSQAIEREAPIVH